MSSFLSALRSLNSLKRSMYLHSLVKMCRRSAVSAGPVCWYYETAVYSRSEKGTHKRPLLWRLWALVSFPEPAWCEFLCGLLPKMSWGVSSLKWGGPQGLALKKTTVWWREVWELKCFSGSPLKEISTLYLAPKILLPPLRFRGPLGDLKCLGHNTSISRETTETHSPIRRCIRFWSPPTCWHPIVWQQAINMNKLYVKY